MGENKEWAIDGEVHGLSEYQMDALMRVVSEVVDACGGESFVNYSPVGREGDAVSADCWDEINAATQEAVRGLRDARALDLAIFLLETNAGSVSVPEYGETVYSRLDVADLLKGVRDG